MTPYTVNRYGPITTTSETSTSTDRTWAGSRSLSCGPVVKGDFKHPNPHGYSVVDSSAHVGGTSTFVSKKRIQSTYGVIGGECAAWFDTESLKGSAYNQALSRLADRARGNLDLATSIAEGKQTVKMLNLTRRFTDAIVRMNRSYREVIVPGLSLRRLRRRLRRWQREVYQRDAFSRKYFRPRPIERGLVQRVSSAGANGWLEFTYGWSPLYQDIYGIATNTVGKVRNLSNKFSASGKQVVNERRVQRATNEVPMTIEIASGFVACRVKATMVSGFDAGLSSWTSLNPLSVGWELTPYSFVVDWFFDVGSYLRSLETAMLFRSQFVSGSVSYLTRVKYEEVITGPTRGVASGNYYTQASQAVKTITTFSRDLTVSYPIPSVPKLNLSLGSSQLLSAAALLRQQIKR